MTETGILTDEVPQWKQDEIDQIQEELEGASAVGIVNIEGIASKQMQQLRKNLYGSARVRVSRNTLMKRALGNMDLDELSEHIQGQSGLIITDENPFKLYQKIEEGKSPAPIKVGQEAPHDIVISEGDTGFDPGPFVGDLQQAGVDARIDEGSIKVISDSVVLEEGEKATRDVKGILDKLEIKPISVGLELEILLEDGTLFQPEDLDIDIDQYRSDLVTAASYAFNLSINTGVLTPQTSDTLIRSATLDAMTLGTEAGVLEPGVIESLLTKASGELNSLATLIDDDALPEELRGAQETPKQQDSGENQEKEEEETSEDDGGEASEEEDDEDEEEDVAEGMGNLF